MKKDFCAFSDSVIKDYETSSSIGDIDKLLIAR